jgi:hypothetical protein
MRAVALVDQVSRVPFAAVNGIRHIYRHSSGKLSVIVASISATSVF